MNLDTFKQELEELTDKMREANYIIEQVKAATGVDIHAKTRKREVVEARQIAMQLIVKRTGLRYAAVAWMLGLKSHATVMHACRVVKNMIETNKAYRKKYAEILNIKPN